MSAPRCVYLDNHATTPLDPRVREAMAPWLGEAFGNPASRSHAFGQRASRAVEAARAALADLLGLAADGVVFTSGATESLNLAIRGLAAAERDRPGRLVCCFAGDHSATRASVQATAAVGMVPRELPLTAEGLPDLAALDAAIAAAGPGGVLAVVATAVHNELGTVAPLAALGARCAAAGARFIVDAAQAPGRLALEPRRWGADLVALTAHKCYGPKGTGALCLGGGARPAPTLTPLLVGGGQERGLREAFLAALGEIEGLAWNGSRAARVAGNLNLRLFAVDAATLLLALPDVALSAGSACASGATTPSQALLALGLRDDEARASVRIGIGRLNDEDEVRYAGRRLREEIGRQREASPLWAMRHDRAALAALGWGRSA
jgi:cysteine desulfurase